jgi:hypothetical protein
VYPQWKLSKDNDGIKISEIKDPILATSVIRVKNIGVKVFNTATATSGTITIKTYKGVTNLFDGTRQIEEGTVTFTIDISMKAISPYDFFPNYPTWLTPKLPAVATDVSPFTFFFRPTTDINPGTSTTSRGSIKFTFANLTVLDGTGT